MPLAHLDPHSKHPLVLLTACTAKRMSVLDNAEAHSILNSLWHDSFTRNGWYVGRYVIMPDHVHLFAMPAGMAIPLNQWVALWKSISSRSITAKTVANAPIWQRDYFDRYIRTAESYSAKWDYVCNNPVPAKLVTKADDWPYRGVIHDLAR